MKHSFPENNPDSAGVYSLSEYVDRQVGSTGVRSQQLDKTSWVNIRKPTTTGQKIDDYFIANQRVRSGASYVYSLPECVVSGPEGLISLEGNVISTGGLLSANSDIDKLSKTFSQKKDIRQVSGTVALVIGRWPHNYFHWMMEIFQKLRLLENMAEKIDHYYLVCETRFHVESLQRYSSATGCILDKKIINIREFPTIRAERLIIPEQRGILGVTTKGCTSFLRNIFLTQTDQHSSVDRFYISRSTHRRHILNEGELTDLLEQYRFKKIVLEELGLQAQVELFAKAKVVLAPHGAGLTNLVFCSQGTKVIELFTPEFISGVYWLICHQINLDYYYIVGDRSAAPLPEESEEEISKNIQIDVDKVEAILRVAEIN